MIPQDTLTIIERQARTYAIHHSKAPDSETPDWIITDYIAGAKRGYELAMKEDGWIKVDPTEEWGLPEVNSIVLVYIERKTYSESHFIITKFGKYGFESASNVTHWMPLPSPPTP